MPLISDGQRVKMTFEDGTSVYGNVVWSSVMVKWTDYDPDNRDGKTVQFGYHLEASDEPSDGTPQFSLEDAQSQCPECDGSAVCQECSNDDSADAPLCDSCNGELACQACEGNGWVI